jgi:hypothetical protein
MMALFQSGATAAAAELGVVRNSDGFFDRFEDLSLGI